MDIKSFAGKIRKFNIDNHWRLLLVSYFITAGVGSDAAKEFWRNFEDCTAPVFVGLFCCISFYDNYLQMNVQNRNEIYLRGSIAESMKFHGFPAEEYFLYLMKRFLPVQALMSLWAFLIAAEEKNIWTAVAGGLVFVLSFLVWRIRKAIFYYAVTHQKGRGMYALENLWNVIFWILSLAVVVVRFWLGIMLAYFMLEEFLIPQDDHLASICFIEGMMPVFVIGSVFWPMALFFNGNTKKKNRIKVIATGLMGLLFIASLCSDLANHTVIGEDHIMVSRNFKKKDYRFDDVKAFEIQQDKKETLIALRFHCKDGEDISVTIGSYTNTNAWDKQYKNEYEFVKDVVVKLLGRGAEGTVREPEKIVKMLNEEWDLKEDKDAAKTVDEMIELLE